MKYFRVKIGFEPIDYISIDETEYPMAVRAQISGKVAVFKEGTVNGNSIITILPDWNRVMGYNRDYKLNGEDYLYIGEARQREYRDLMELENTNAQRQLEGKPPLPKLDRPQQSGGIKSIGDVLNS